jgi:hypothetical protein
MPIRNLACVCLWVAASSVEAATPRAYLSVSGNDANTCNVPTTPCRTFVGAISQVTPGGVVIVMDSGTFGGGTISQPVTIDAPAGVVAVAATPLVVTVSSGKTVVLRGLTVQSPTPGVGSGITVTSGDLVLENSVIDGWEIGVAENVAARVSISHSQVRNNTWPFKILGGVTVAGIYIAHSQFFNNEYGVEISAGNFARLSDLEIARGTTGIYCAGNCDISDVRIWDKFYGILDDGVAGVKRLNRVEVTGCFAGLSGGGSWESYGNNVIRANNVNFYNGAALTSAGLQ